MRCFIFSIKTKHRFSFWKERKNHLFLLWIYYFFITASMNPADALQELSSGVQVLFLALRPSSFLSPASHWFFHFLENLAQKRIMRNWFVSSQQVDAFWWLYRALDVNVKNKIKHRRRIKSQILPCFAWKKHSDWMTACWDVLIFTFDSTWKLIPYGKKCSNWTIENWFHMD